ncbi:MAG: hypothetical protein ACRBK7_15750 [Acidimicrobiales bacterium]
MTGVNTYPAPRSGESGRSRTRIPLWRRITALFTLSFMTVLGGILLAGILGLTALMILFVLERAIAT